MTARLVAVPTPEGKDPVKFLTAAGLTPAAQAPILAILAANGKDYSVDYQRLWSDARDAWYTIIPTPSLYQVTAEEIVSLGLTEERTRHWKRFMDEMDDLYHVMHEIMGNVITNDTFFEVDGVLVPMREFLVPAEWKSVQVSSSVPHYPSVP
jgi:hypothetical protein